MTIRTIEYLLNRFGSGKNPGSADYVDLIDTLADDRNAVYFSSTAPVDTNANPLWFNTNNNTLSVYSSGSWVTGSAGEQGLAGPQGPQGIQGEKGDTGDQGIQGIQGENGPQGIQGIQGETGATGAQGIQGETGSQGQAGASVTLKGSVVNYSSLPSSNNTIGDSYINDDDGNLYVWNGTIWFDAGQIVGPQGPQGIQGEQGPQGPQGIQGIQGIQGQTGPAGAAGDSGVAIYESDQSIISIQVFN